MRQLQKRKFFREKGIFGQNSVSGNGGYQSDFKLYNGNKLKSFYLPTTNTYVLT